MKKAIKIIILLTMAIGWMLLIFKLSGMNSSNSNSKSTDIISVFVEDTLDITNEYGITSSHPTDEKLDRVATLINAPMRKVIHASVYFVLALFVMTFLNIIVDHKKYIVTLILTLIICAGFAASDEFHQTFVNGRTRTDDGCANRFSRCNGWYIVLFNISYCIQSGLQKWTKKCRKRIVKIHIFGVNMR